MHHAGNVILWFGLPPVVPMLAGIFHRVFTR